MRYNKPYHRGLDSNMLAKKSSSANILSVALKIRSNLKILQRRNLNQLNEHQQLNDEELTACVNNEKTDVVQAQERTEEPERIERFKCSGL